MESKIFEHLPQHHEVKGVESPLVIGSIFDKIKDFGKNVVEQVEEAVKKVVPVKQEAPKPEPKKVEAPKPSPAPKVEVKEEKKDDAEKV